MDPVVHFEIPFTSEKRAKSFYQKTFGWKMNDIPEMEYTVVHTTKTSKTNMPLKKGIINGGMMKKGKNTPHPILIMKVASVVSKVNKAVKNGATLVMPKIKVGDMGFYARVKDTEGNIIGIWQDK